MCLLHQQPCEFLHLLPKCSFIPMAWGMRRVARDLTLMNGLVAEIPSVQQRQAVYTQKAAWVECCVETRVPATNGIMRIKWCEIGVFHVPNLEVPGTRMLVRLFRLEL